MLCKCYWIVLYIVHFTAFCLGGPFFSGHGVHTNFRLRNNNWHDRRKCAQNVLSVDLLTDEMCVRLNTGCTMFY